jgi:signal transduction histidine kinase
VRGIESPHPDRFGWPLRRFWPDLAWVGFTLANLVAMALAPEWETVPFHFIWVSLTILYGYRVWGPSVTAAVLTAVVVSTGGLLVFDVIRSSQLADELTEVPLMGAMFLAMVWHAQRRRSAMEDLRRVSDANLRLLHRERQFIQDASHELRTPITVALGHAELVERASREPELAEDARIVVDELQRLRRLADRLLLLATSEDPDFLSRSPVQVEQLLAAVLQRWTPILRRWRLDPAEPATVIGDADRLELALDALVENAVKHTGPGDEIRLGAGALAQRWWARRTSANQPVAAATNSASPSGTRILVATTAPTTRARAAIENTNGQMVGRTWARVAPLGPGVACSAAASRSARRAAARSTRPV